MQPLNNEGVVSSRVAADHILFLRSQLNLETTTMQIIKLVYICHGWMLGFYERKLISEPVEAWRYGPVVPSVYRRFKAYRGDPIDVVPLDQSNELDDKQRILMKTVIKEYKEYDGLELSSITHMKNTPWDKVYRGGKGLWSIIPNRLIQEYYAKRVEK